MSTTKIITINQVYSIFKEISVNNQFINDFGRGPISEIGRSKQMKFPYLWASERENSQINVANRIVSPNLNFYIIIADRINIQKNILHENGDDSDNKNEILSDTFELAKDFVSTLMQDYGQFGITITNDVINVSPFSDETTDKVCGRVIELTLKLENSNCTFPNDGPVVPPIVNCPKAFVLNSDGSFSEVIAAGGTLNLPDVTVTNTFNGDVLGTFPSAKNIEVNVESSDWVRNPDWLPMPDSSLYTDVFFGLFLVFENETNALKWAISSAGAGNIDPGDGTAPYVSNGLNEIHYYDYSTLPGPINVYEDGRNYKQVMVTITTNFNPSNWFVRHTTSTFPEVSANFVDVHWKLSQQPFAAFALGSNLNYVFNKVERIIFECEAVLSFLTTLGYAANLQVLEFIGSQKYNFTNFVSVAGWSGTRKGVQVLPTDFFENITTVNQFSAIGLFANIKPVKKIIVTCSTNSLPFRAVQNIEEIDIGFTNTPSLQWMALDSYSLIKATIRLNSNAVTVTNMNSLFSSRALRELIFDNCDITRITANNFSVNLLSSLQKLIMPGFTRGVNCSNTALEKEGIEEIGDVIGLADGSQTYTFTNCPGSLTADYSVFITKGYTIVT